MSRLLQRVYQVITPHVLSLLHDQADLKEGTTVEDEGIEVVGREGEPSDFDFVEDERSYLDESFIEATIEQELHRKQGRKFISKLHLWLFGDMDVGKTYLIVRYCDRFFTDSYSDLDRFESKSRFLEVEGEEVELVIRKSYNYAEDWKKKISLPG
jgi:hypothetical protein